MLPKLNSFFFCSAVLPELFSYRVKRDLKIRAMTINPYLFTHMQASKVLLRCCVVVFLMHLIHNTSDD